jgi:hypothetical protein
MSRSTAATSPAVKAPAIKPPARATRSRVEQSIPVVSAASGAAVNGTLPRVPTSAAPERAPSAPKSAAEAIPFDDDTLGSF